MKRSRWISSVLCTGLATTLIAGCASGGDASSQLVDARRAYAEAAASPASTLAQRELRAARRALDDAEIVHREAAGSAGEQHLAYLAQRHAELARARARTVLASRQLEAARTAYAAAAQGRARVRVTVKGVDELAKQNQELARRNQQLTAQTRQLEQQRIALEQQTAEIRQAKEAELARREAELAAQQAELARQTEALEAEREARAALEAERDEAMAKLEEFAAISEDERGTIITVGGGLLFRFNEATLLPTARAKLDQVAEALKTVDTDQNLVIEGHADAIGSAGYNRELSRQRALAVRTYLVSKGVDPDKLVSMGKGEEEPIASNESPEGRANNRRVEIVISPPQAARAPERAE